MKGFASYLNNLTNIQCFKLIVISIAFKSHCFKGNYFNAQEKANTIRYLGDFLIMRGKLDTMPTPRSVEVNKPCIHVVDYILKESIILQLLDK